MATELVGKGSFCKFVFVFIVKGFTITEANLF